MNSKKPIKIYKTHEFIKWLNKETAKSRAQIEGRLINIETEGHFGIHKLLEKNIWELKWANGRRVYYAYIKELNILLLLGGNKNGQQKDIINAKKIFKNYKTD